jgi:molybdenum cofactor synthesis domain-containing protein
MTTASEVSAAIIIIGNEVLSGRTQDLNLQFLAAGLNTAGIRVREARVVGDDEAAIIEAVNACRTLYNYVFTTGGIGPTHDDITSACIAKAFGVPLIRHPQAEAALHAHFRPEDRNPARMRMADVPAGAELIENPVSRAPGFCIGNVYVLPGVPAIMRAMFDGVRHRLAGGTPMLSQTISAYTTEGVIAEGLAAVQARLPAVEIGSYPFVRDRRFGVSLVARSADASQVAAAAAAIRALLAGIGVAAIEDDPGVPPPQRETV